jgi:hypothetical protein
VGLAQETNATSLKKDNMLVKLIKWYFKALWWFIVLVIPFFMLWLPILPIYDWIRPWDEAVAALKHENKGELRWMVGFESDSNYNFHGEPLHCFNKRDYILIPSVFSDPSVYGFSEGTDITKGLKKEQYGAFGYLALYIGIIVFSWFVSKPRILRLFQKRRQAQAASEPPSQNQ